MAFNPLINNDNTKFYYFQHRIMNWLRYWYFLLLFLLLHSIFQYYHSCIKTLLMIMINTTIPFECQYTFHSIYIMKIELLNENQTNIVFTFLVGTHNRFFSYYRILYFPWSIPFPSLIIVYVNQEIAIMEVFLFQRKSDLYRYSVHWKSTSSGFIGKEGGWNLRNCRNRCKNCISSSRYWKDADAYLSIQSSSLPCPIAHILRNCFEYHFISFTPCLHYQWRSDSVLSSPRLYHHLDHSHLLQPPRSSRSLSNGI